MSIDLVGLAREELKQAQVAMQRTRETFNQVEPGPLQDIAYEEWQAAIDRYDRLHRKYKIIL